MCFVEIHCQSCMSFLLRKTFQLTRSISIYMCLVWKYLSGMYVKLVSNFMTGKEKALLNLQDDMCRRQSLHLEFRNSLDLKTDIITRKGILNLVIVPSLKRSEFYSLLQIMHSKVWAILPLQTLTGGWHLSPPTHPNFGKFDVFHQEISGSIF